MQISRSFSGDVVGRRGRGSLADERGMLLILTMVILLVLATLAGASLITALLVRSQVRSQANAAIALNAAEAGLAAGMAWLSDPERYDAYGADRIPDPYLANPAWERSLSRTLANGGSYAVKIRFLREREDRNGDGDCCDVFPQVPVDEEIGADFRDGDGNACATADQCFSPTDATKVGDIVLFNSGTGGDGRFGFTGSYYAGGSGDEGYPVVEISAAGAYGASAARQTSLFVARNHKAQVEGAFTARSQVDVTGSAIVDGTNYDNPAIPGSCGSNMPGVTVDVGVPLPSPIPSNVVTSGGGPAWTNFDPTAPGKRTLSKTPWDALGISETDFNSMFTNDAASTTIPLPCSSSPYYAWYSRELVHFNNSSGCNSYTGVLVIHNQGFDPDVWEVKCDPVGRPATYDSTYCNDSTNKPAVFKMEGSVQWTGIIIADASIMVTGNPTVIGGVITLGSGGGITSQLGGNITIKYSCDSVAYMVNRIGYKKKIGWRRLR